MGKVKIAKATVASKTVAKRVVAKKAATRAITNEFVNRNRNYKNQLADLKSGLKNCLRISSRTYVSRFGEASIWIEMQFVNGTEGLGIAKTRETELLISNFLKGKGSFAPKRATTPAAKKKAA
ncbi:MAG TPA: hypothetical protein VGD22_05665 [Sphingobacteriaceae bacterium]